MDDPVGAPETPLHPIQPPVSPPTTPAGPSTPTPIAPSLKQHKSRKILRAIAANNYIQAVFIVLIIASVAAASYYIGWHRGYKDAVNVPANGQCTPRSTNPYCNNQMPNQVDKPVINLYPTKSELVNVRVVYPAGFTYTDPTYNSSFGWNVAATPSGTLTNLADNEQYPYLVWEGNPLPFAIDMSSGFVVSGTQTNSFLRAELPIIGLSPSETNAFIAYWLPRMSGDKYNLIHFVGKQYTDYAKLIINPAPNSELRVMMAYRPLNKPVAVVPQAFPVFHRVGFTVVEWGGTKLAAQ